jgi:hypothetical protein|tara:strand:- start:1053 stop:1160 length:108 start_codon:yes stop_codon:yes gene_type:complete
MTEKTMGYFELMGVALIINTLSVIITGETFSITVG